MKKQGGQDIIEFTLMVPLFFVCLFAIMAGGLFFRDYITYNSVVRSAAREASLVVAQEVSDDNQPSEFSVISNRIFNEYNGKDKDHPHLYIIKENSDIKIKGMKEKADGNDIPTIEVELTVKQNSQKEYPFIQGVANAGIGLPATQHITYYMYWENYGK